MKKRILILAAMLSLIAVASSGQNGKKYYKAGTEFAETMKYEDAVVQFTSAIGLEPMNPEYYVARGDMYVKLGNLAGAKADYEKALVFAPKDAEAMISLAVTENGLGNYSEALRILNRASSRESRNPGVYPQKVISLYYLKMYDQALKTSDTALTVKDTPGDYFWRGRIYESLRNQKEAIAAYEKSISKDKKFAPPRVALAGILMATDAKEAMAQVNEVLKFNDRDTSAYLMRSRIYMKALDPANAINDISKCILIDPANPAFYMRRGDYYLQLTQYQNAINDYTKYISLSENDPKGFYKRATAYEGAGSIDKAITDYEKITAIAKYDVLARELLDGANQRLFKLNEERDAPVIALMSPVPVKNVIQVRGGKNELLVSGKISDKSKIKKFMINGREVQVAGKPGEYEFLTNIDVTGREKLSITAVDDYNNEEVLEFPLFRTEITPPVIRITAPYAENGQIFIDRNNPSVFIQGKIEDESKIKAIYIDNRIATFDTDPGSEEMVSATLNPEFMISTDITNKNKITVKAEDIYGNVKITEYVINREGAGIASTNPMGKTWVIFIENSGYKTFGSLDGPIKDITTMRRELENYQIHRFIHKKDMTKKQMEMFFNIELRDEIKANQVKSILIWYAGHGKYINDVGYWIPVDAERDQEFTYFNINFLKAGLMGYENDIVHTLVISDACESGPGFFTAMRAGFSEPSCDDSMKSGSKSAQIFSSVGQSYELTTDNSKFASSFANALRNAASKRDCIPIETIVLAVQPAVKAEKGQEPKFGTIQGLKDLEGTFFFIKK
ncbi:MAG: tetratricopeptide repeat protein [Bacteroidales bacterium]|jgi:tetratricopeptide (TPR) repeat protein|nr:tetratricopeptide repeat protein [Bacteroidales bacterium]